MDTIKDSLLLIGCSEKEIRLYLAAYKIGTAPLNDIAKAAKLQRSTAYLICRQLVDKNLLEQDHRNYKQKYTAVTPDKLIHIVESKKRRLGRSSIHLQEQLSSLKNLYGSKDIIPHVTTYQGKSGLVAIWNDILTTKSEILLWTNQTMERQLFETAQHRQFIRERTHKQIPIRVLAVDTPDGHALITDDKNKNRQTKILGTSVRFTAETYLYDNKVAIIDYTTDIIGVIIENKQIHEAQEAMFELAWTTLQ